MKTRSKIPTENRFIGQIPTENHLCKTVCQETVFNQIEQRRLPRKRFLFFERRLQMYIYICIFFQSVHIVYIHLYRRKTFTLPCIFIFITYLLWKILCHKEMTVHYTWTPLLLLWNNMIGLNLLQCMLIVTGGFHACTVIALGKRILYRRYIHEEV